MDAYKPTAKQSLDKMVRDVKEIVRDVQEMYRGVHFIVGYLLLGFALVVLLVVLK